MELPIIAKLDINDPMFMALMAPHFSPKPSQPPYKIAVYWDNDTDNAGTWLNDMFANTEAEARTKCDEIAAEGKRAVLWFDGVELGEEE